MVNGLNVSGKLKFIVPVVKTSMCETKYFFISQWQFFSSVDYDVETYNVSPLEELSDTNQKENRQKRKESMAHSSASVDEATSEETDTDSTTTSISDNDHDLMADTETANLLFPNSEGVIDVTQSNMLCQIRKGNDLSMSS